MADNASIIKEAQERYKADKDYWSDIYRKAAEDLYFMSDAPDAQWPDEQMSARKNRNAPTLTIDQLGQFVHQVVNDIRMNTPTINVIPDDSDADDETAEVLKGLIKNIEYQSNADESYDTAANYSVKCGIGFLRVDNDYKDRIGFEQDLVIKRVVNPLSIYLDCESIEADGSDAMHVTVTERISIKRFKRKYPKAKPVSFEADENSTTLNDDDFIVIAEQFIVEEEEKEIGLTDNGDIEEAVVSGDSEDESGKKYKRTRSIKKRRIRRLLMAGEDILADSYFPGEYLPIVPVYGEEEWIKGKRNLYSLIRKSKDAQRQYNFWKSLETELLMKQPEAPFIAAEGSIDGHEVNYQYPAKTMVLQYKPFDDQGRPFAPPQRLSPPTIPTGIINAAREAVDDIKATLGMYNASIGAKSNETSGIAIQRRQQEGDVATYHFGDNLNRSIAQLGRVLVCAIPEIYDTPRIIRIVNGEDEYEEVGVNGKVTENQKEGYDLKKGKYGVRVVTGASFTTRRQEAASFFQDIFTRSPELLNVMGDLMFKNMDFAGAQQMAERMKKVIDPKFLQNDDEQDPAVMAAQQAVQQSQAIIMQLQQEMAAMQQQLESKQADTAIKVQSEQNKAQADQRKAEIELLKLQLEQKQMEIDAAQSTFELQLKQRELEIKEQELQAQIAAGVMQSEVAMRQKMMEPQKLVIADGREEAVQSAVNDGLNNMGAMLTQNVEQQNQAIGMMAQTLAAMVENQSKPKTIIRNKQGYIDKII